VKKQRKLLIMILLQSVKEPKRLTLDEKKLIITWADKMFKRAEVEDIEGNYRRH
jgi:hypothetical protein